jgi:hypothetical protein
MLRVPLSPIDRMRTYKYDAERSLMQPSLAKHGERVMEKLTRVRQSVGFAYEPMVFPTLRIFPAFRS